MPRDKQNQFKTDIDLDSVEAIHNAIQESYEVGAGGASLNDVGNGGSDRPEASAGRGQSLR